MGPSPGAGYRTVLLSFSEVGRRHAFLDKAREHVFRGVALENDSPHSRAAARELTGILRRVEFGVARVLGHKADLLGRGAAWRREITAVAVSRVWTGRSSSSGSTRPRTAPACEGSHTFAAILRGTSFFRERPRKRGPRGSCDDFARRP